MKNWKHDVSRGQVGKKISGLVEVGEARQREMGVHMITVWCVDHTHTHTYIRYCQNRKNKKQITILDIYLSFLKM